MAGFALSVSGALAAGRYVSGRKGRGKKIPLYIYKKVRERWERGNARINLLNNKN